MPVPTGTRGSSEQRLVARVAAGDDQAFEEIFDRYAPALLSFCVHMLGNREWGEDALQLTFVAAYKALRRGGCDGALRPWLYAIARNRCLSELRTRRDIPDSDGVSADKLTIDGPASLCARREQLREIVDDIQRLPADQRAALVLFELGDQSHAEIAAVLGVRREKVKALIFQAREGLHRVRTARESACSDVQERVANARGKIPARGVVRAHIDRCAPCQAFERDVRSQRAALALVIPVALSGKLKALVLSSAFWHGSVGTGVASISGASGAGSVAAASAASSGSVGGAISAAAGSVAPTMVASALAPEAVAGVGAKIAAVLVLAVGVGGVARSALESSPRAQAPFLAGEPRHAAPLRSPFQPLVSGVAGPLVAARHPALQLGARPPARAAAPTTRAARGRASFSSPRASFSAYPTTVSAPTAPRAAAGAAATGTASAPVASAPDKGAATTRTPSSGSSTTTTATATTTTTTTAVSSPTTTSPSVVAPGKNPGHSGGQGQSSGEDSNGATHSNGNGPSTIPPGCDANPSPGCAKKTADS